jgi:ribosomal protein S18 acetylase RimI-like enzyme
VIHDLVVRAATLGDAAAIVEIGARAARQAYADLVTPDYLDRVVAHFYGRERIEREIPPADQWFGYRVAQEDAWVIGLAGSGRVADAPERCELFALYVDPRHQRRGAGRALLADAMAQAQDAGARWLQVAVMPGNARATAFYEAMGFTHSGERPIYAPHGEAGGPQVALVFQRPL